MATPTPPTHPASQTAAALTCEPRYGTEMGSLFTAAPTVGGQPLRGHQCPSHGVTLACSLGSQAGDG